MLNNITLLPLPAAAYVGTVELQLLDELVCDQVLLERCFGDGLSTEGTSGGRLSVFEPAPDALVAESVSAADAHRV